MKWNKVKFWLRAIAILPFAVAGLILVFAGIILKAAGFLCMFDAEGAEIETRSIRR